LAVSVTERERYIRETLSAADAPVTFYRHEDLAPEQVLDRLFKHYVAWAVKGARREHLNSSELSPSVWRFGILLHTKSLWRFGTPLHAG
jgi:hypothetical protein